MNNYCSNCGTKLENNPSECPNCKKVLTIVSESVIQNDINNTQNVKPELSQNNMNNAQNIEPDLSEKNKENEYIKTIAISIVFSRILIYVAFIFTSDESFKIVSGALTIISSLIFLYGIITLIYARITTKNTIIRIFFIFFIVYMIYAVLFVLMLRSMCTGCY